MSQLQDNLNEILTQKNTILLPANIKRNVTVLGVTGTYTNESSSVAAANADIKTGKVAYVNGVRRVGTLPEVINPASVSSTETNNGAFFKPDDAISTSGYGCYIVTDDQGSHVGTSYLVNWVTVTSQQTWYIQNQQKVKVGMPVEDIATLIGLTPEVIKKGVTILGVTGTYEGD